MEEVVSQVLVLLRKNLREEGKIETDFCAQDTFLFTTNPHLKSDLTEVLLIQDFSSYRFICGISGQGLESSF